MDKRIEKVGYIDMNADYFKLISVESTVKPCTCEHLGTRAKMFNLGGVHISEVFS